MIYKENIKQCFDKFCKQLRCKYVTLNQKSTKIKYNNLPAKKKKQSKRHKFDVAAMLDMAPCSLVWSSTLSVLSV